MNILTTLILVLILFYVVKNISNFIAGIAQFKYASGNTEGGFKLYKLASKIGKMNINHRIRFAYLTLKEGDIDEANKLFNLIAMEKLSAQDRAKLKASHALVPWKKGDIGEAIEMLEYVDKNFPSTTTYGSLGCMYIHNGNLDKALEYNLKAYEYNSDDAIILDNLSFTYLKLKDYENAEKYYNELFEKQPTFPEGYFEYGKYLIETKGDREKGIEFVKKALDCRYSFLTTFSRRDVLNYLEQCGENISKLV